jgi:hypothetical protein
VVTSLQAFGIAYPLLAGAAGLLLSLSAWTSDHRGRHVYALSLPVARWRYVLMRYQSGLVLLLLPMLGIWLGAILATRFIHIPPGLHPLRDLVGAALRVVGGTAYTAFFAISSGTPRTAGIVLGIAAVLVAIQVLASAAGFDFNLLKPVFDRLFIWPGHSNISPADGCCSMCSAGSMSNARWVLGLGLMLGLLPSDGQAQDVASIRRHIAELEQRKVALIAATDSLQALERARRLGSLDSLQVVALRLLAAHPMVGVARRQAATAWASLRANLGDSVAALMHQRRFVLVTEDAEDSTQVDAQGFATLGTVW